MGEGEPAVGRGKRMAHRASPTTPSTHSEREDGSVGGGGERGKGRRTPPLARTKVPSGRGRGWTSSPPDSEASLQDGDPTPNSGWGSPSL